MSVVNSVLGPISSEKMGLTLIHEHLISGYSGWQFDVGSKRYDRKAIADICMSNLREAKEYGLRTMVDATPIDLGRDVELQKIVSTELEINIICATGFYLSALGSAGYFRFRNQISDATTEIYETFMSEITHGIQGTGVKAGVIKLATGRGKISRYEEMVFRAAARAQKETGVPIITHTEAGTMGPEQLDILVSEGVDPGYIVIGHMCGNVNLGYHISVLKKGSYIGFDRLGIDMETPDLLRKACIIGLVGIGYVDRIMLSNDYVPFWLGRHSGLADFIKKLGSNWSYTNIFRNIIPALKAAGVSDRNIDIMLVENPKRLFSVKS